MLQRIQRSIAAAAHVIEEADRAISRATTAGVRPRALPRACLCLIVDDEEPIARLIANVAREEFLTPLVATTLEQATTLLGENDVRRAIVDGRLRAGTSAPLLAALREREIDHVILTGYPHDSWLKDEVARGETVIEKPDEPGWAKLREWMRRRT